MLFRLLERPLLRGALYALTPATLCARYALSAAGLSLPVQAFCGSWIIFYLLGLEWRDRIGPCLHDRGVGAGRALALLVACLALQEAEGFAWLLGGSYDLATTQLKATSMLSSVCACALVALAPGQARRRLASCGPLMLLGDASFGIYLCHMAVLAVLQSIAETVGLSGFVPALVLWPATLASSSAFVVLCQRVLPKPILAAIGFV